MSMKEEVQTDLAEAMDGDLAEATKAFTYTSPVGTTYSPSTGQVSNTSTPASGRGIFYDASAIDYPAVPTLQQVDTKAVVLQNELSSKPLVEGKLVTTADSLEYSIVYVKPDPVGATWELYLERLHASE